MSAHMRVTLGGDLAGFTSLGFDDHVKLFFPQDGWRGRRTADGFARLHARRYDPRRQYAESSLCCTTPARPLGQAGSRDSRAIGGRAAPSSYRY